MRMLLAALAALMAVAGSIPAEAAPTRAVQRDWTKTVTRTPTGAYVLGNPAAKVKLVEYLSMTCGHCAHFSEEAWAPLRAGYVGKGLVSLEIRHALRDGFDLAASLIARCGGPQTYFGSAEAILANQRDWLAKAGNLPEGPLEDKPISERLTIMAHETGLDALAKGGGLPEQRIAACLASPAEQKILSAMATEAWQTREIGGTPAFLINGELQEGVATWEDLEPRLKAVLK